MPIGMYIYTQTYTYTIKLPALERYRKLLLRKRGQRTPANETLSPPY